MLHLSTNESHGASPIRDPLAEPDRVSQPDCESRLHIEGIGPASVYGDDGR
jgi:hypothetical protein